MKAIKADLWSPADNMILEPNALDVVKESKNCLVVAGPGAGKTELLAQKATYLLQTNTCAFPCKILAISFKRDAAYNLKERVKLRSGDELSRRFESLTFDSFAKQILDRFKPALPKNFKIDGEYNFVFDEKEIFQYYRSHDIEYFNSMNQEEILNYHNEQLPYKNSTPEEIIRNNVWSMMLNTNPSRVSFKMIMRLAEYIVNSNPKIKNYLQQTYKYVFLDEFQDTTGIQYDFYKSCFLGSNSFYTAVGDDKQRIMLWAGAHDSVFEDLIKDTGAQRVPLTMNFRCAPIIVNVLNHLTINLLGKNDLATASPRWQPNQGECSVCVYENPEEEAKLLFEEVKKWIEEDGINPREICFLVKQQLSNYAGSLIHYFNENGLSARDEDKYQNILTDDISSFIVNFLYTIYDKTNTGSKKEVFLFMSNLHTEFEDLQLLKLEKSLSEFIKNARKKYSQNKLNEQSISEIIEEIIDFANKDRIKAACPVYKNGNELESRIFDVRSHLTTNFTSLQNIVRALDKLVGKDTIPVMTIHKSKGLEYHTVVFIGLEDGAFWSFQRQPDEDKCAFFVALSRAKERVLFTFSKQREGRYGIENQTINKIKILFQELDNSKLVKFEAKKLPTDS